MRPASDAKGWRRSLQEIACAMGIVALGGISAPGPVFAYRPNATALDSRSFALLAWARMLRLRQVPRTDKQKEIFDKGLKLVNVWYGHQSVVVIALTDTVAEPSASSRLCDSPGRRSGSHGRVAERSLSPSRACQQTPKTQGRELREHGAVRWSRLDYL
jgi:hypothetical protein